MSEIIEDLLRKLDQRCIDPNSPTPLYYQLFTMLHDAISGGVLATGAKMPSEKELAAAFAVSRITARRALDELALKKMVARHRGRGTFVDYKYQPDPIHAPLSDLIESLDQMGRDTKVKALSLRFELPPASIRDVFGINTDAKLCHIIRVFSNRKVPFAYYVSWTLGFDRSMSKRKLETQRWVKLLKEYGIKIGRVEQFLTAQGAALEVADELGINTGKPMLKLVRNSFDDKGQLRDVLTAYHNPDLFRYKTETRL